MRGMGYRYLNHQGYLIFYRVNDGENLVDIMAIFHEKMDYLRVLRVWGRLNLPLANSPKKDYTHPCRNAVNFPQRRCFHE